MEGRRALHVQWDEGKGANLNSAGIRELFVNLAAKPGAVARKDGEQPALASAAKKIEAVYEVPYLSHAPMEPMNCTADVRADSCEVWAPRKSRLRPWVHGQDHRPASRKNPGPHHVSRRRIWAARRRRFRRRGG